MAEIEMYPEPRPGESVTVTTEAELERLARLLGGGWRIERGVMPVLVLTITEAQALEARLSPTNESEQS
jgi:hypothetical protein